jgi:hypothetical protein
LVELPILPDGVTRESLYSLADTLAAA